MKELKLTHHFSSISVGWSPFTPTAEVQLTESAWGCRRSRPLLHRQTHRESGAMQTCESLEALFLRKEYPCRRSPFQVLPRNAGVRVSEAVVERS